METIVYKVEDNHLPSKVIEKIQETFRQGGLVAFPTETVYGLGANALEETAAIKIYEAKGRPSDNPLIIHIANIEDLSYITEDISEKARILAEHFWPGPLTLIMKKSVNVPKAVTGGLDTVAVRIPDSFIALEVIKAGGGYVAAPSANTAGRPSPTAASHVLEDLNGKIDVIVDGGTVQIGLESTIVDMTEEPPVILRPGYISEEMLEEVIGTVVLDKALESTGKDIKPKAPGMKYKHYAPKGNLVIVEGENLAVIEKINQLVKEKEAQGFKVAVIGTEETVKYYQCSQITNIGSRIKEENIAQQLYKILREFDGANVEYMYSESFYTPKMGQAIMNRLLKAAGYNVIHV